MSPLLSTPALKATLVGSAILGTAYSLPPLRLKRFPLCVRCFAFFFRIAFFSSLSPLLYFLCIINLTAKQYVLMLVGM